MVDDRSPTPPDDAAALDEGFLENLEADLLALMAEIDHVLADPSRTPSEGLLKTLRALRGVAGFSSDDPFTAQRKMVGLTDEIRAEGTLFSTVGDFFYRFSMEHAKGWFSSHFFDDYPLSPKHGPALWAVAQDLAAEQGEDPEHVFGEMRAAQDRIMQDLTDDAAATFAFRLPEALLQTIQDVFADSIKQVKEQLHGDLAQADVPPVEWQSPQTAPTVYAHFGAAIQNSGQGRRGPKAGAVSLYLRHTLLKHEYKKQGAKAYSRDALLALLADEKPTSAEDLASPDVDDEARAQAERALETLEKSKDSGRAAVNKLIDYTLSRKERRRPPKG